MRTITAPPPLPEIVISNKDARFLWSLVSGLCAREVHTMFIGTPLEKMETDEIYVELKRIYKEFQSVLTEKKKSK